MDSNRKTLKSRKALRRQARIAKSASRGRTLVKWSIH